jgi:DNA-binding NtrC family response regulator
LDLKAKILVVDDERGMREFLKAAFEGEGYNVATAANGTEALELLGKSSFHLVVSDIRMPDLGGIELLAKIKEDSTSTSVVVITAYGSIEGAVEAMKKGASDYLTKPLNLDELRIVVRNILQNRRLSEENTYLKDELSKEYQIENFIAHSPKMVEVLRLIRDVAPTPTTVLIRGESGTGKELVARAIHNLSDRKERVFVAVNCAALSETLLESELFGHEKGAFTGAISQRKGRFETADGGTLFLDEIGEMSSSMQAKLLRVLEEKSFERVGGTKTIGVDVRIISATNKDLEKAIAEGAFREDLYYRLNVVSIVLPPLRERREDIIPLAESFLDRCNRKLKKRFLGISSEARDLLLGYGWGGNIRELENAIERAAIVAKGNVLGVEDLPLSLRKDAIGIEKEKDAPEISTLAEMERRMILKALREVKGSREEVARALGISVRNLQYKLKEYRIVN